MPEYAAFARFYDALNDEPEPTSRKMLRYIDRYAPDATSVLELGCGTGAVLAGLGSGFSLSGIDQSPEMLAMTLGMELNACGNVTVKLVATVRELGMMACPA